MRSLICSLIVHSVRSPCIHWPPTNATGDEGEEGFEKIKSKTEKKKDKLLTMDPKEISYEMVSKKLREITLARGKKGVDRQEQVRTVPCLCLASLLLSCQGIPF